MQSQYIGYGIKGFYRIGSYAIKPSMSNTIIQERLRVLEFWEKHGLQAALDYSNKSRRTLFNWKKEYQRSGLNGLRCKSTTPKTKRKRQWPLTITNRLRFWRTELPNLGKEQLHVLLKPWCTELGLPTPSESTIGRLIGDAHDKMRVSPPALTPKGKRKVFKRAKVTRRPKGYKASRIGECVGLDAIERRMGGMKMYILTYIDEVSDYALAMAVPRLTSRTSKQFFEKCFKLTPFNIEKIITDNGSEFKGEFDQMISDTQITHLWTYPSTPKMNAVCERFNRTIQEQFIDYHEDLLFTDLDSFNEHLADWLVKYNSVRPHKGLGLKTPMQYIIENKPQCNMWWTHTVFCKITFCELVSLLGAFLTLVCIFSLKTTYYFSYQNMAWWLYFCVLFIIFLYAVYFCYSGRPYSTLMFLVISILIGYMPYEVEVGLINDPVENLSPIAADMPLYIGIYLDMFFYPMLAMLPLSVLYLITRKHHL